MRKGLPAATKLAFNRLKAVVFVSVIFCLIGVIGIVTPVQAIDDAQRAVFDNGIALFNLKDCDDAAAAPAATGSTALVGNDNVEKAFNYLVAKGIPPIGAAAIIGNLMIESHLDPAIKQGGGGPGRGIAQWSVDQRWQGVVALAQQEGKPPEDLGVQLDFLLQELNQSYKSVLNTLKTSTDVQQASDVFLHDYEAAADREPGGKNSVTRGQIAKDTLAKFGGGAGAAGAGTSTPGGGGAAACSAAAAPAAAGNGDIVKTALSLAWPQPTSNDRKDSEPSYIDALNKFNQGSGVDQTDCGRFVATVMHMAAVDPDYPDVGTSVQGPYLDSHPDKFQKIGALTNVGQLQPGDILMNAGEHTEIYVGDQGGGVNTAGASLGGHIPNQNGASEMAWLTSHGFTIYRPIKGAAATAAAPVQAQ